MDSHIIEWLNLTVRWIHVITGIAWIGASFYFNWLENALNRTEELRDEIAGNLWAIHGGGFYFLEKYKVAPAEIPKELHWFKYEAYFTWISGFALLIIVYYLNAKSYLMDPRVSDLSPGLGVALGLGSLVVGWLVYDLMCRSSLVNHPWLFVITGFFLIVALGYGFTQIYSSRAAYIHVGAVIGTCMAANVFMVIIPFQKKMVKMAQKGEKVDAVHGKKAFQRSLHNNYMTLPVLFIMISNHFPSTYGNEYNWAVLGGLTLVGGIVRHYYNLLGRGKNVWWILPIALAALLFLTYFTSSSFGRSNRDLTAEILSIGEITYREIAPIMQVRCNTCHSANPTDDIFVIAPNGVVFDTYENVVRHLDGIKTRAIDTRTMPLANKTLITEEERLKIRLWIERGAPREE